MNFENFVVGINLPWIDDQYDHDFGYNMTRKKDIDYEPSPTYQRSKKNFEKYIKDISEMGIKVVRLWLFERFEGLTFDNRGNVTKPTTDMRHNLRDACSIAQKYNVKFYFCLMDTWGILANDLNSTPRGDPRKKYSELMNGMITTKEKRDSFLQAVADILSDEIIKKSVWAIDVLNEPDGIERTSSIDDANRGNIDTGITWDQLGDYIKESCKKIKKETGYPVSCGIRLESFNRFKDMIKDYLDFFDIHHYDNDGNLPSYQSLGISKPCIVGESGQGDREERNDLKQKIAVKKFLGNSKSLGYSGCFIWEYGFIGGNKPLALINSDGTHRSAVSEIINFT